MYCFRIWQHHVKWQQ